MLLEKALFEDYLMSVDPKDLHKSLISKNGVLTIFGKKYKCIKTILNVLYMHHGFILDSVDLDHKIILMFQQVPICLYTDEYGMLWSQRPLSPLVNANKQEIENRLQLAFRDTSAIKQIILKKSTKNNVDDSDPIYFLSGTQQHMSHYLWNHLSGLWDISYSLQDYENLNLNIVDRSELYGDVTQILTTTSFHHYCIQNYNRSVMSLVDGLCIEPYYKMPIPNLLCREIIQFASQQSDEKIIVSNASIDEINVCLAPRFGSRECINLDKLLAELLAQLTKRCSERRCHLNLFVYLATRFYCDSARDKKNQDLLKDYGIRLRSLIECTNEYSLVNLKLLEDEPFSNTLSYLKKCNFVVSEWGASMALTSWILALPSIVLAPSSVISKFCGDRNYALSKKDMWGSYVNEANHGPIYFCGNILNSNKVDTDVKLTRAHSESYCSDLASFSHHLSHMISIYT